MRRVWITLTVTAVAIALALPAAAVKPDVPPGLDKPPAEAALYEVTMGMIEGEDGFSTSLDCTDGGHLEMELSHGVALVNTEVPFLQVKIGSVNWDRHYPYLQTPKDAANFDPNDYPATNPSIVAGLTGEELTGCHGGGVDVTIAWEGDVKVLDEERPITQAGNYFRLTPSDGAIELVWHSDYYNEWENVSKNPKKTRYVSNVMENFTYIGNLAWTDAMGVPVVWDPAVEASGIVSGIVEISRDTPFNEAGSSVKFLLTITPIER